MTFKNTKLKLKLKELLNKNKDILDVILFGSVVRGKENTKDTDIIVLFKDKVNKEKEYLIRRELENLYSNVNIISKTEKTVIESSFDARESVLFEGISLITGKNLAQQYGFTSFGAFKYNFSGWNKLQKTKFYYALNGRGRSKGVVGNLSGIKLSDSLILIPLEKIELFRDFMENWKINYLYFPLIIPQRVGRKNILEA